jgi:CRISPR-associated endoribonuclease Cas6
MPAKVFIKISAPEEIERDFFKPDRVHGLFFSLVGENLARRLHEGYGNVKPYSLYCEEIFRPRDTRNFTLEVNILDDGLTNDLLSHLILNGRDISFDFGSRKLPLELKVSVSQRWVKSYSSIIESAKSARRAALRFISPATFKRNRVDYPFPSPELVFKGLVKKWLSFSDITPEVDLREFYDLVEIERYSLRTTKVIFSSAGKLTAFVGEIFYNFSGVKNGEALRWFGALLELSMWSGVGRKTTMGLGKVKVLSKEV